MLDLLVRFVGPVRRPGPERTLEVDRSAHATVGDLLGALGYTPEEQRHLTVLADGVRRSAEAPLHDVQRIEILVAIGGG